MLEDRARDRWRLDQDIARWLLGRNMPSDRYKKNSI